LSRLVTTKPVAVVNADRGEKFFVPNSTLQRQAWDGATEMPFDE